MTGAFKRKFCSMKPQPLQEKHEIALRSAIARCRDRMRAAKRRGDLQTYQSYLKQMYALRQQQRNAQRGVRKGG